MEPCPYDVTEILYHAPPMILIERVLSYDAETVTSIVDITERTPFLAADPPMSALNIWPSPSPPIAASWRAMRAER